MLMVNQLIGFGGGGAAGGPITYLGTGTSVTNNATVALTTLAAVATGETIILAWSASANLTFSSATDGTNSYTQATSTNANGVGHSGSIAYVLNPTGIASGSTITVTISGSNTEKTVTAWKANRTLAFDSGGGAIGADASPTASTGGSIPSGGLVFGYSYNNDTDTYTALAATWTTDVSATVGASSHTYIGQSEVTAGAGAVTFNPALSGNGTWYCGVAGFH